MKQPENTPKGSEGEMYRLQFSVSEDISTKRAIYHVPTTSMLIIRKPYTTQCKVYATDASQLLTKITFCISAMLIHLYSFLLRCQISYLVEFLNRKQNVLMVESNV